MEEDHRLTAADGFVVQYALFGYDRTQIDLVNSRGGRLKAIPFAGRPADHFIKPVWDCLTIRRPTG